MTDRLPDGQFGDLSQWARERADLLLVNVTVHHLGQTAQDARATLHAKITNALIATVQNRDLLDGAMKEGMLQSPQDPRRYVASRPDYLEEVPRAASKQGRF